MTLESYAELGGWKYKKKKNWDRKRISNTNKREYHGNAIGGVLSYAQNMTRTSSTVEGALFQLWI